MRCQELSRVCALMACMIGLAGVTSGGERISLNRQLTDWRGLYSATRFAASYQDKKQEPKMSEDERKALKKIQDAAATEAKLQAAAEFVKKWPKSARLGEDAKHLAGEISKVQGHPQKISAAKTYLAIFTEPAETDLIQPILIAAYLDNKQADEGFSSAAPWLEKHPEALVVMMDLAIAGANEAASGNSKFLQQSQQYGMKAVEMMEADKKPATFDATQWAEYKTRWLPVLYRELGIIAMRMDDKAAAKVRLEKAVEHKTTDPTVYAILGGLADDEYIALANKYAAVAPGAKPDESILKKAKEQLDKVIELYARAIALADGKLEYKQISDQLMPPLQNYYKYRHRGSADGLQQMIDKYKKTP